MADRTPDPIDPGVDIGHVHLKVADVDRALDFYCGVLGFELMQRYGADAAFVAAGGYHHHSGSTPGSPPAARLRPPGPPGSTTWRSATRPGARWPTRCDA